MNDAVDEILEHYGTKGMRWGVRKSRNESERAKQFKKGGKEKPKSPKAKDLSDEELKKAVSRMQLERQYTSLSTEPKLHQKGADFAKKIATTAVTSVAVSAVTYQVSKALQTHTKLLPHK